ncbi:MAG: hypothetical protein ACKOQZ_12510 [Actinomycetota bacterium]
MKIRETLRNARFIGEMTAKGLERHIRATLSPQDHEPTPSASATTSHDPAPSMTEPFEGYDLLTARQIIAQCRDWTNVARDDARRYEEATRGRRSVIQALA